jgi:hypothetical protein
MASEMVERVVRALTAEFEPYRVFDEGEAERLARAAIAAMREPTEAMVSAGSEAVNGCYSLEPGEGFDEPPAPAAWQAMIDAALA